MPSQREEMRSTGQAQRVERALPEHGGACFGGRSRFVEQVGLFDELALVSCVSGLFFDHVACGGFGLFGESALQFDE